MTWFGNAVFAGVMKMRSCRGRGALSASWQVSVQGEGRRDMGCGGKAGGGGKCYPPRTACVCRGCETPAVGLPPEPLKDPPLLLSCPVRGNVLGAAWGVRRGKREQRQSLGHSTTDPSAVRKKPV